jgi:hypothetical protein
VKIFMERHDFVLVDQKSPKELERLNFKGSGSVVCSRITMGVLWTKAANRYPPTALRIL